MNSLLLNSPPPRHSPTGIARHCWPFPDHVTGDGGNGHAGASSPADSRARSVPIPAGFVSRPEPDLAFRSDGNAQQRYQYESQRWHFKIQAQIIPRRRVKWYKVCFTTMEKRAHRSGWRMGAQCMMSIQGGHSLSKPHSAKRQLNDGNDSKPLASASTHRMPASQNCLLASGTGSHPAKYRQLTGTSPVGAP